MTMGNKIVKVYVLKGLNGTSLVIENYRVSNEKIYGMLTPIYTFEVATDDILQAIGQKHNQSKDCVSRQMVKEGMIKYGFRAPDMTVTEFIEDELPPVTPTYGTCKDCKHCCYITGTKNKLCEKHSCMQVSNNWYCADFEKRGNENG